jgi:hypothetical protein
LLGSTEGRATIVTFGDAYRTVKWTSAGRRMNMDAAASRVRPEVLQIGSKAGDTAVCLTERHKLPKKDETAPQEHEAESLLQHD